LLTSQVQQQIKKYWLLILLDKDLNNFEYNYY